MPQSSNVIPLQYAASCHSALVNILYHALQRAVPRGLVSPNDAEELLTLSAQHHSGIARGAVEAVIGALERDKGLVS
jgi:hypothetical protein